MSSNLESWAGFLLWTHYQSCSLTSMNLFLESMLVEQQASVSFLCFWLFNNKQKEEPRTKKRPGLDNTRLLKSLTAGAGTGFMSLLSSSPSLKANSEMKRRPWTSNSSSAQPLHEEANVLTISPWAPFLLFSRGAQETCNRRLSFPCTRSLDLW